MRVLPWLRKERIAAPDPSHPSRLGQDDHWLSPGSGAPGSGRGWRRRRGPFYRLSDIAAHSRTAGRAELGPGGSAAPHWVQNANGAGAALAVVRDRTARQPSV